jgi:DNA polymerase III sliding clamp (beta) subunit (PCNA family)
MTTIHFHRNTLSDQIKRIKGLIDKNPVLPILSDFHFVLSGDKAEITATVDGHEFDVTDILSAAETMIVHVNIKSLQEAINALEYQDGVVQFGINGASRPLTMQSFEEFNGIEAGEIHLLMPLNPGNSHD